METEVLEPQSPTLDDPTLQAEEANLRANVERAGFIGMEDEVAEQKETQTNATSAPDAKTETEVKGEKQPDNPETKPDTEKAERARGPDGKFVKAEAKPEEKPESNYEKAKKEAERRDRSWKALEQEKAQVRAQAEQLARQQAAIQQRLAQQQNQARLSPDGQHAYTAKEYADAATEFSQAARLARKEGNDEEADKYEELSDRASEAAKEVYQFESTHKQQAARAQFARGWQSQMEVAIKENPDLGNGDTDLSKEVQKILAEEPLFGVIVDGFKKAVAVAQLRLDAGLVSGLRDEIAKLKADNERLTKATGISGSPPTKPAGPRNTKDATLEELDRELRAAAEQMGEIDRFGQLTRAA